MFNECPKTIAKLCWLYIVKLMTSFQTNCFGFVSIVFSPIPVLSYFVEAPLPHPLSYLLNWRSWKIQTWHDDRHAVHQCFCTKIDSWYLDLTSSVLSELDIHFYRILLISQYFLQFKSTSELKFGLLVPWLMNIYWWNLNSNELKWHHNDVIFFVQFCCYNPCWCQQIFKFAIHWK